MNGRRMPSGGGNRPPSPRHDEDSSRAPAFEVSPARAAAFEILLRVAASDAHSDDLLHSGKVARLSQEDRNLATALVMGVLRWQIALDSQIAQLLVRPGQRLAEPIAMSLRIGAFQLLHMDRIPAHAAINESVELCRAAGQAHAAGMVNAVLRKLATQVRPAEGPGPNATTRHIPIFEAVAAFAGRLGHPAWLVERWVANYGRETALAICEYDQREPPRGVLFSKQIAPISEETASLPGSFAQMDDGSRLVAELAAAALQRAAAPRIWDCCAAPGGKTLVLAERLPEAEILATDISAKRLARMRERVRGTPHADRIRCEAADAATPEEAAIFGERSGWTQFDLVLCDAPCSGTGTLARNPEMRDRLRPEDLTRQAARQRAILRGALSRLAPGGLLLYSTCSLEPEENELAIEAVLATEHSFRRLSLEPLLAGLAGSGILDAETAAGLIRTALRGGCLRTLPGAHPCDGFYAVLLESN